MNRGWCIQISPAFLYYLMVKLQKTSQLQKKRFGCVNFLNFAQNPEFFGDYRVKDLDEAGNRF
jgi:hypothetical protein